VSETTAGEAFGRGKEIAMTRQRTAFFGLKQLLMKIAGHFFRESAFRVLAETYEDITILIEPASSYKLCRFESCRFKWIGEDVDEPAKIFSICAFDNCDFGRPLKEFLAYTNSSTIDQESQTELTRRLALEEAVRRIRQRHPYLTAQCLDPCCRDERQFIARWVSAEYHNIIAEAA
jgi:hypothetical protein